MKLSYYKFLPFVLAFVCFAIYLFTAAPFMLWLDATRFVAAIATLGVANPPEPLYILLAHPFIYLPFGSLVFRIQILSALLAGITLVLVYKLAVNLLESLESKLLKSPKSLKILNLSGLFSLLTLAFSYQFWSQAQNVENFILVSLMAVVVLLLVLRCKDKKSTFINLSIIALLMGLGTGTNPVLFSITPAILWMMWNRRKYLTAPGFGLWIVIGFLAIILIHLYIPIRAAQNPFLNYWKATTLERVWGLSTGGGLNVYVPDIGRINGFTGSPEIFFQSAWNYIKVFVLKFTPIMLPFIFLGGWYLYRKSKYYFYLFISIVATNFILSGLYFSGNQESWFLMSDISFVLFAGLGYFWLNTSFLEENPKLLKYLKLPKSLNRFSPYFLALTLVPLVFWWMWGLDRHQLTITRDYINNLYKPMEGQKAILFGSSDLYDSVSYYIYGVPGTPDYRPNVVPITDNLLYILRWYRDNLKDTTDLKIPDDAGLKYDSAQEYSKYINDFFAQNIDKYKIFVSVPAQRNNFLYGGQDLGASLHLDETRFKYVPQGMLLQVVKIDDNVEPDPKNFEYSFQSPGFPKVEPHMLERTYNTELTGVLNEFAYSLENLGDYYLKKDDAKNAFEPYQKAYEFNPKNAEVVSRLGNFYGMTGDHKKATEYFEQALKIEPRNIGLLFNSAIAYENTGRIDKAITNLNKVLQYSKGDSQIAQLARTRLEALKSANPSGQLNEASGSGGLQAQLMPKAAPDQSLYSNANLNLQFVYPKGFILSSQTLNSVNLSNNLAGKDELTFNFYSQRVSKDTKLDEIEKNMTSKVNGAVLITQPINLPGFKEGMGKTFGTGEHLTFLLLLKTDTQGFAIKIYPGDTSKTQDFNNILQSIKTLQ